MMEVKVIPNGVDVDHFKPLESTEWFERKYGELAEINIVFTGRLSSEKGVDYLIKSLEYLSNTRLFICGNGPEKSRLENLGRKYNSKVRFLGKISRDELPKVLSVMDVYVLPCIGMEGFSNSMLEAMACGLPVITTPVGAGPEVVNSNIGRVVEKESPELIAIAVDECVNYIDRDYVREHTVSNYSFDRVSDVVYSVYSGLCGYKVKSVCFCSLFSPPYEMSGAGIQVHELAKALKNRHDCDVAVVSSNAGNSKDKHLEGVKYIRTPYVNGRASSRFLYSFAGSLKRFSIEEYDIVDGRNWEGGLVSLALAWKRNTKSIVSFRGEGAVVLWQSNF